MPMSAIEIARQDFGNKGRYVHAADRDEAEMTFVRIGASQIIIDHTEVPSRFRGQGVGEALVSHAVEDARENGWKVGPLCPFAAAQFRRHPEWSDVLAT
ncbi:GNAT family N-acetyltransferase [Chelativorans sp. AA-79]|uniref:GNAT family N-acetyltransferase n=1 Tax=Chelativorans sp. AA-79 TaxID=3028735 RepID=UPI0023F78AF7|nr:GNAT family N-acetyltransferase [Chelativorans sp. AA-79]WEX10050.1 GNAT family N-acetyltransferase [Chelativorans sp. AA-79]